MDLTINGGYGAYADVALLQISILYLQRHDFNRRTSGNAGVPLSQSIDDYLLTTRFVAAGLNWASWLLAVYIWQEYGLASAALFFLLGLGSSVMATILIPPLPRTDVIAHILSFPATVYLFSATLRAVGFGTSM